MTIDEKEGQTNA